MKRLLIALLVICLLPVVPVSASEPVYTVALDGSGDYETVHEALSAARAYGGGVVILVKEGIYSFSSPLNFEEIDRDIVIKAQEGEEVVFTGGTSFTYDSFEPVTDEEVLKRIVREVGRKNVKQVKLSDVGVTDYGSIKIQGFLGSNQSGYSPTLTMDGVPLTLACYPNGTDNYLMCTEVLEDGSQNPSVLGSLHEIKIKINSDRYRYWKNADEIWSLGYLCHDWADSTVPVTFDQETGVMSGYVGKNYYAKVNRRIKFFNLLEELDEPGEWYLDRKTGILYLIPPEGAKEEDVLTFTTYEKNLVTIKQSSNITFEGITFTGTTGYGAYLNRAKDILFKDCEFSSIGNAAVYMNECYRCGVTDSYFHDLGSWGVYMNRCGDRTNLIPGECFVENTEFERFSQYKRTYSPAVHMYEDVGNRVSHCEFHDAPHFAIRYDSNDNIIEYSEFYDLCQETADTGAVYTGRYWNTRGNEVRYNYFHDLYLGSTPTSGLYGVYLDDAHSSTAVHHNIFYKVSTVALMGGGRDNAFTNNMIVDCGANLIFDARCYYWMDWQEGSGIRQNTDKVVGWQTSEVWSKYPHLQNLYEDEQKYPKYNVIQNNISLNTSDFKINDYVIQYGTVNNNMLTKNTKVVKDYQKGDFSPSEQAASIVGLDSFDEIPLEEIGVQRKVKASLHQPRDREQIKTVYFEDFSNYKNNELYGTVQSGVDYTTLHAQTKPSGNDYEILSTRQKKDVNIPIVKNRTYRLMMEYSVLPDNQDKSLELSLVNGLVFDQSSFTYYQNGSGTTVSKPEYYYFPIQSAERRKWEKEYSYDRSMNLKQLFFLVQGVGNAQTEDVWGGGVNYTVYHWQLSEKTKYHQLKFVVGDGGSVFYTNRDMNGENSYLSAPVEDGGLVEAESGTSPEITIVPKEGYQVTTVNYPDGEMIHYNSDKPITLTMDQLSQSGTVGVSFAKTEHYSQTPGLAASAFYMFERDAKDYTTVTGQKETGPEFYFYTATNGFAYTDDSEAGFMISKKGGKTYQLPVVNQKGIAKPVTPYQQFGIKVFGPGIRYGTEYTVTPYVRQGEEQVMGDAVLVCEE